MIDLTSSAKKIGFVSEFWMNMIKNERWATPISLRHITTSIPFGEGTVMLPEFSVKSHPLNGERIKLHIKKSRTQIYSDPLDTDTQWFVTPKDLKETSNSKTIGYQEERAGWSCYEDERYLFTDWVFEESWE